MIQDFHGFVHEAFCQQDWFLNLMGAIDELKVAWEALFRTLSVDYDSRYQRFWYLVGRRKIDDAMEIELPEEGPERKMRGIVFKIFDCLEKLKLFARDSIDKYGALRDEAFRQFDHRSSESVLSNPSDLMQADYYRNLAYVSGTDSEFSVIREPLQFFNQCLDELFSCWSRTSSARSSSQRGPHGVSIGATAKRLVMHDRMTRRILPLQEG